MPTSTKDPEIEFSPLCSRVIRDEITVEVMIYRVLEITDQWSLEVVDDKGTSTVWDDTFETDAEALQAFEDTVQDEGMEALVQTRH